MMNSEIMISENCSICFVGLYYDYIKPCNCNVYYHTKCYNDMVNKIGMICAGCRKMSANYYNNTHYGFSSGFGTDIEMKLYNFVILVISFFAPLLKFIDNLVVQYNLWFMALPYVFVCIMTGVFVIMPILIFGFIYLLCEYLISSMYDDFLNYNSVISHIFPESG